MKNTAPQNDIGFTRLDLLAIAAMVFLLGLIGAQKLAAAPNAVAAPTCTGNQRQLLMALHLYASDNGDFLPYLSDDGTTVPNTLWLIHSGATAPDATNSAKLINPSYSMLAPYLNGNPTVFKCPADLSTVLVGGKARPRVRSVSMSLAVGTNRQTPGGRTATDGAWLDGTHSHKANQTFRTYARMADVVNPRPQNLWVFLDEHPDSMNDTVFSCMGPTVSGAGYQWIDWPATYHNGAGGFGFMDGHGEIHVWAGPGTLRSPPTLTGAAPDLSWLATHVTSRVINQP
jgi:hypothetical protein